MSNSGNPQRFNIEELADKVANQFEAESREVFYDYDEGGPSGPPLHIEVTAEARRAITEPVLANGDHIAQELAEGRITEEDLRLGLQLVLREAYELAAERYRGGSYFGREEVGRIDVETTREVIETRCPYLFWC